MTSTKLTFVSFEPRNGSFTALLPMEKLVSLEQDPELLLRKAAKLYEHSIVAIRSSLAELDPFSKKHVPIPARKIWHIGNIILELRQGLEQLSLEIDGLYDHLVRDLCVKRNWLERVIIFRRYLPDVHLIPASLNWGRCAKGPRKVAEQLREGHSLDID